MRGLEHQWRPDPRPKGLNIATRTDTPLITGTKPGKTELRGRRGEVVAHLPLELEKLGSHPDTGGVLTRILCIRLAATIPEKTGEWITRTGSKRGSEHVFLEGHGAILI